MDRPGREADHSRRTNAEVDEWNHNSVSAIFLYSMDRDIFTLFFIFRLCSHPQEHQNKKVKVLGYIQTLDLKYETS